MAIDFGAEIARAECIQKEIMDNTEGLGKLVGEMQKLFSDPSISGYDTYIGEAFWAMFIGWNDAGYITENKGNKTDRASIASVRDVGGTEQICGVQIGVELDASPIEESGKSQVWDIFEDPKTGEIRFDVTVLSGNKHEKFRSIITDNSISFERQDEKSKTYIPGASISYSDEKHGASAKMLSNKIRTQLHLLMDKMPEMESIIDAAQKSIHDSAQVILSVSEVVESILLKHKTEYSIIMNQQPGMIMLDGWGFSESYSTQDRDKETAFIFKIQEISQGRPGSVVIENKSTKRDETVYAMVVSSKLQDHEIPTRRVINREEIGFPSVAMPSTAVRFARAFRQAAEIIVEKHTREIPMLEKKVDTNAQFIVGRIQTDRSNIGALVIAKGDEVSLMREIQSELPQGYVTWEPILEESKSPDKLLQQIREEAVHKLGEYFNRPNHPKRKALQDSENGNDILQKALDEVHEGKDMTEALKARFVLYTVLQEYFKKETHTPEESIHMLDLLQSVGECRAMPMVHLKTDGNTPSFQFLGQLYSAKFWNNGERKGDDHIRNQTLYPILVMSDETQTGIFRAKVGTNESMNLISLTS